MQRELENTITITDTDSAEHKSRRSAVVKFRRQIPSSRDNFRFDAKSVARFRAEVSQHRADEPNNFSPNAAPDDLPAEGQEPCDTASQKDSVISKDYSALKSAAIRLPEESDAKECEAIDAQTQKVPSKLAKFILKRNNAAATNILETADSGVAQAKNAEQPNIFKFFTNFNNKNRNQADIKLGESPMLKSASCSTMPIDEEADTNLRNT